MEESFGLGSSLPSGYSLGGSVAGTGETGFVMFEDGTGHGTVVVSMIGSQAGASSMKGEKDRAEGRAETHRGI